MINTWFIALREKPTRNDKKLSNITCNHALTCLNVVMKEAVRLEYIHTNPAEKVRRLIEKPKEKGILTIDEMHILFDENNIDKIWNGDVQQFTFNLLSASTGMRMNECQALQVQYVNEKYINVFWGWGRRYGLIPPKRNSRRKIPIPSKTSQYLFNLIDNSHYRLSEDLVFHGKDRNTPIRNEFILKRLYEALEHIGISSRDRIKRNLTFHSWRFFYNTLIRGRVPDVKLRRLTGHRSEQMSDWYTRFNVSDYQDVLQIQEEYFR